MKQSPGHVYSGLTQSKNKTNPKQTQNKQTKNKTKQRTTNKQTNEKANKMFVLKVSLGMQQKSKSHNQKNSPNQLGNTHGYETVAFGMYYSKIDKQNSYEGVLHP